MEIRRDVVFFVNKFLIDIHGSSVSGGTIEAIRLVKGFLIRKGGVKNVDISKDMLNSCKGAYRRYGLDLRNKKKRLEEEEVVSKAAKEASALEAEKNAKGKEKNKGKRKLKIIFC